MAQPADRARATAAMLAAIVFWISCSAAGPAASDTPAPGVAESLLKHREDALTRVRVWQPPATEIGAADLGSDPAGPLHGMTNIDCTYVLKLTSGITPKFHCVLPSGRVIKVKYGRLNAEPPAEIAATRLLSALGFGADRMHKVRRVRCRGCPVYPHPRWKWLNRLFAWRSGAVSFKDVVIEDPLPGRAIEAGEKEGWAWHELDKVDPSRGGASRAELDAFRLMAVFLVDWDNKAVNQALVCLPGGDLPDGGCRTPFAYLQDVGATFGPSRMDLDGWRSTPIWADAAACRVSMKALPFSGATFRDTVISEGGRRFLADQLKQLRTAQLQDLFTTSGFTRHARSSEAGRDVNNWVAAFEDKVRQIADRPPCPEP